MSGSAGVGSVGDGGRYGVFGLFALKSCENYTALADDEEGWGRINSILSIHNSARGIVDIRPPCPIGANEFCSVIGRRWVPIRAIPWSGNGYENNIWVVLIFGVQILQGRSHMLAVGAPRFHELEEYNFAPEG